MGSKRMNLQRPPSSDSSSSSEEEEEQAASPPPAKKPSLKSTSPKTKPPKSPQPPSSDDEEDEDEDGEPPVSQKKDQKKKEVSVKKDEKKNEEEEGSSDEEESSSDEEEEKQQDEEEDEGSSTSDDEKQQLSKKPDSIAMSASGSDSDSEPSEKPAAAGTVTPAASGTKRPRDSAPSELENTEKKKVFQRIWGADDEIKILKGIIAFYSDKGSEPSSNAGFGSDLDAIHSLLKKSLGLEFSRVQLGTKIRGLRRKFQTNASRGKNNTDPKLTKPHQQEIYELSKKIWRHENPNETRKSIAKTVKSKGKSSALKVLKDQEEVDIPEGDSCYEFMARAVAQAGHGDISWSLIKRGLKLVDPEKARPLEKRLQELELARMRHRMQWLDKREEATQLIIDSIAKSAAYAVSVT
ncbi:hypothetical protein J5N97_009597 [Dioscorea zingiberensis]|uniref:Glabrous enhancer-binding protein-like DBD domain-containing protein n=1 Tax=Dioscorea zingiberensis TaxID=325984 RepID=A0A9D5CZ28_9LILI|nr:hypothetical protein J5N97_009597 [Dioscorea zingiberensis]